MRCLHCHRSGIPVMQEVCPQCGVHLPSLLRDVLPPGTRLREGSYHIDYALGRGGFGITYRAMHVALEQEVAIKEFYPREHALRDGSTGQLTVPTMHKVSYERALQRFMREGRILARMSHPGVVRVQDLFEERGTGYMVMELIGGRTLRELLDAQPSGRLPADVVWKIAEQLVAALEAVHEKGVYHLDIKPDNVLVKDYGGVTLVDFGAARQGFSSGSTQAFTLEYAAPEVLAGSEVGPESDLFEVGMTLYEMLTGERPAPALNRAFRDEWKPKPLSEPWRTMIDSALRIDREARPRTLREWWDTRGAATRAPQPLQHSANAVPTNVRMETTAPSPAQVEKGRRAAREDVSPLPRPYPPSPGVSGGSSLNSAALIFGGCLGGAALSALAGRLYWAAFWSAIETRDYVRISASDWNDAIWEATATGALAGALGGLVIGMALSIAPKRRRGESLLRGAFLSALVSSICIVVGLFLDRSDASETGIFAGYYFSGSKVAGFIGAALMLLFLGPMLGALKKRADD